MARLGQFYLAEQLLGETILPDPLRSISHHRIPLGFTVRKSLLGTSFPKLRSIPPWGGNKIQPWPKESTYRHLNGSNQHYRYFVSNCPTSSTNAAIWQTLRDAIIAWRALSAEQKKALDDRARQHNTMSGYNLYIREYIRANY